MCLVVCFVIVGSAYMSNILLYCTRFDSFVCTDVWCNLQTHLDCVMNFSFTRAGVLFKVLGRLCLRHRLANSCCVLNVCNLYCLCVLSEWMFAFGVNCQFNK